MALNGEQSTESLRRKSAILALLPLRTSALFHDGLLSSVFPQDHKFKKFFDALDTLDSDLRTPAKIWNGPYRLYDLVVDDPTQGFSAQPLAPGVQATAATATRPDGKLSRPAAELLSGYLCVHKFYDTLAWISGKEIDQVLRHKKRQTWSGIATNTKIWQHLADLPALLNAFRLQAKSLSQLASSFSVPSDGTALPLSLQSEQSLQAVALKILGESTASVASSKCAKILANFSVAALNVAFMRMGFTELPNNLTELESILGVGLPDLSYLLKNSGTMKGLRCPFQIAMFITPVALLIPNILSKESLSVEDLVVICKELGNDYPPVLEGLHRDILSEVLRQSCGMQNSVQTLLRLSESWKDRKWDEELVDVAGYYKKVDNATDDNPLKLFEGDVVGDIPETWPLSDLMLKHIRNGDTNSKNSQPGSNVNYLDTNDHSTSNSPLVDLEAQQLSTSPLPSQTFAQEAGTRLPHSSTLNDGLLHPTHNPAPEAQRLPTPPPDAPVEEVEATNSSSQNAGHALPKTTSLSREIEGPITPLTGGFSPDRSLSPLTPVDDAQSPQPIPDDDELSSDKTASVKPTHNESPRRYSTRKRGLPLHSEIEEPEAEPGEDFPKDSTVKLKRRKIRHVSEALDMASIVEHLSREDGRRQLDEVIRVKQEEQENKITGGIPALRIDQPSVKFTDSLAHPFNAEFFDCNGKSYKWRAFFHNQSDFNAFTQFYDQLQLDYPETSIFHILTRKQFDRMPTQEIQKLLRNFCIVINEEERPEVQFDIPGLERVLGSIRQPTEIQDQSIAAEEGNFQHRITIGTPEDLYRNSTSDHALKKSLNALNFPNPNAGIEVTPFSSEARAYLQTTAEPYCAALSMPIADIRWSLCATEGAHHYWHIDSNGFGTFIALACGVKVWAVAREMKPHDFASMNFWANPGLDVTETRNIHFTEAIVLTSRQTLLMGPARPHAVWTLEPSLCQGGHFIATSTLDKTVAGIIHGFFLGNIITNTDHEEIWNMLQRQMIFYHLAFQEDGHLPDLDTLPGLRSIFLFFCIIELQHVFCILSYREAQAVNYPHLRESELALLFDVNAASKEHRWRRIYSRGVMRDLICYMASRYHFFSRTTGNAVDPYCDIFVPQVAWIIVAAQEYYRRVYGANPSPMPPSLTNNEELAFVPQKDVFEKQLDWAQSDPLIGAAVQQLKAQGVVPDSIWPDWCFGASLRPVATPHEVPNTLTLSLNGARDGDRIYFSVFEPIVKGSVAES
ncbi:hypothetical protein H1R20_g3125, partial [Candolleomyces eurysporus]